jgi:hypothetical protein
VFFELDFSEEADDILNKLQINNPRKYKKVSKALGLMQTNLRHPSLNTHLYDSFQGPNQEKVFESYAENNTPSAWRIFWYYGSEQGVIIILTLTPHP